MIDPLEQTIMTDFVTDNGYEWAFLYFRALMFNANYEESIDSNDDAKLNSDEQKQFVKRYWGSIEKHVTEIDHDYLDEIFEAWCGDEANKLTLPEFTDIAVVHAGETDQLSANTIYLCTEPLVDTDVVKSIFAEHLQTVMLKANQAISKKALFSEFQQGGGIEKLHKYERWLDAALLADMLAAVDSDKYDRLDIFVDLMSTQKACWAAFQKTFGGVEELHTMKLRENTEEQDADNYDESNYDRTELKPAFDRIGVYVKQGRGLIQNVANGKLAGVR